MEHKQRSVRRSIYLGYVTIARGSCGSSHPHRVPILHVLLLDSDDGVDERAAPVCRGREHRSAEGAPAGRRDHHVVDEHDLAFNKTAERTETGRGGVVRHVAGHVLLREKTGAR